MKISHVITGLTWTSGLIGPISALSPAEWRGQSIYQVITDRFARTDGSTTAACDPGMGQYCGGTWQGIISHLDYIQNMGFTAIWISPVVKNLEENTPYGTAYHGYWAQDIYSLNSNFGTEDDLKALSAALHARGMYLMVDVVTNHMGYLGCGNCVDYSVFNPFNSSSDYHPFCLIDYNNATSTTNCWEGDDVVPLPDLRTEDSEVQATWNSWITSLVATYEIDGLRIDSAQQVQHDFFPSFQSAAGVHVIGEVFNGDPAYVCPYQDYMSGVMNFPTYFKIKQAFQSTSGSMSELANGLEAMKSSCADTTILGSFSENHDVVRFASLTSDLSLAKNTIAFTILQDGIPIIYAGQEQHYSGGEVPYDREATWLSGYNTDAELYKWTAAVNQIRNQASYRDPAYLTYQAYATYFDSSTLVLRKSSMISVFSNQGTSGSSYTLTLPTAETGFTASQALIEVMSCTAYTTDSSGNLAVAMASGLPKVFYPLDQLTGSAVCTSLTGGVSATTTASSSCTTPASVAVTFTDKATTVVGQTIKIVGSVAELGSWNVANAIALSASGYTVANPIWAGTVNLAPGTVIEYKYINVTSSGEVAWEADPNHVYTVPASCATAAAVANTWQ